MINWIRKLFKKDIPKKEFTPVVLNLTSSTIADYLEIKVSTFNKCIEKQVYKPFKIKQRNGKIRQIKEPGVKLKAIQHAILEKILYRFPVSKYAHGFVFNRSTATNAVIHSGKKLIINLDIQDFFPSIGPRVIQRTLFKKSDMSIAVINKLPIVTKKEGLPQGAPTSPALANIVMFDLDNYLGQLTNKLKGSYTRYADDLTFSFDNEIDIRGFIKLIKDALYRNKFKINKKKTKIMRYSDKQLVNGIIVNKNTSLEKGQIRLYRAIIHNALKKGATRAKNKYNKRFGTKFNLADFRKHLVGKTSYFISVNNKYRYLFRMAKLI